MKSQKKNVLHQYWGPAALFVFFLLLAAVFFCKSVLGLSLRSIPLAVFIWLEIGILTVFFIWLNIRACRAKKQGPHLWLLLFSRYALPVSIVCILIFITLGVLTCLTACHPEHITEQGGHQLVVREDRFFQETIHRYQYKGPLFYGLEIDDGFPASEDMIPEGPAQSATGPLPIAVTENRENELIFDISVGDFINSYNSFYSLDKNAQYLPAQSEWRASVCESAVHSEHETTLYEFTADKTIWSQPTITVYVPTNADAIQEVTVNFDEHGYSEPLYAAYEEICFYTLKVFFPELPDETIIELYKEVNRLGKQNVFTSSEGYASGCVPCVLYHKDGIGVYPYFAIGEWVHLCIIPVTDETVNDFAEKGVEIREIASP